MMTDARIIESDPAWLPHRVDVAKRQVEFLYIPRAELSQTGFLADRAESGTNDQAIVPWDEVKDMKPESGDLHFIFHTAFCRSTLLVRSLDLPGKSIGLNEPGIIASLVNAGSAASHLIAPILALLARPHAPGEVVWVKPTNHANMIMPALLKARPDAKAVLMSNTLPAFLSATARKGMMGRRWGRQLFLELQSYAGMDFGMDGRESFIMSDMQAAGLAWFLAQRWFAMHLEGKVQDVAAERLRLLDGDRFNSERAETYRALFGLIGTDLSKDEADLIAAAPLFSQHSKLGGDFGGDTNKGGAASNEDTLQEEIEQVNQWVGMIAQQASIEVPIPQTLF